MQEQKSRSALHLPRAEAINSAQSNHNNFRGQVLSGQVLSKPQTTNPQTTDSMLRQSMKSVEELLDNCLFTDDDIVKKLQLISPWVAPVNVEEIQSLKMIPLPTNLKVLPKAMNAKSKSKSTFVGASFASINTLDSLTIVKELKPTHVKASTSMFGTLISKSLM